MQRSAATISASLKKVPPFPPVAAKLLELLQNPAVDSNEVADLISSDSTFTARLLQRANSAQFGFVTDVTSARRAVALLGLDLTRQITLSHATAAYVGGAPKTEALRRSWQHTIATAVLAEEIAIACEMFTSVAFTAGIMHDIGRLGLLVAYPDEYEGVIRESARRCLDLLDFEEETFGVHHAEAGRMLAESWGLPPDMAVIAGRHHDACEGTELNVLRIVHVACRLADVLGYDVVKPLAPMQRRASARGFAATGPTTFDSIAGRAAPAHRRTNSRIRRGDFAGAARGSSCAAGERRGGARTNRYRGRGRSRSSDRRPTTGPQPLEEAVKRTTAELGASHRDWNCDRTCRHCRVRLLAAALIHRTSRITAAR